MACVMLIWGAKRRRVMKRLILLAVLLAPALALARPTSARFDQLHVTLEHSTLDPYAGLCSAADPSGLAVVGLAIGFATRRRRR
jgi:uncharacterized protein (TIGR03382 family)